MNKLLLGILLIMLTSTQEFASDKVLIITHVYNRPDFIELQDRTFKAFLKDDYEYVVFNDASDKALCAAIKKTCDRLNVRCIRVPQKLHNAPREAGARHQDSIKYSLENIGFFHEGVVLLIDSDMFLFRPFGVYDYMGDNDIAGLQQLRGSVVYIGPFLVFMNMCRLPNKQQINFDGNNVNGELCDTGGHTYYYLQDNPTIKVKFTSEYYVKELAKKSAEQLKELGYDKITSDWILSLTKHFDDSNPHLFQFHGDSHFIHYAAGSNWNQQSKSYHIEKTRVINLLIDQMIEKYGKKQLIINI